MPKRQPFNAEAGALARPNGMDFRRKLVGSGLGLLAAGTTAYLGFTHYVIPWWHQTAVPWWQHTGKWYAAGVGLVGVAGTAAWGNRQRIYEYGSRVVKNQVLKVKAARLVKGAQKKFGVSGEQLLELARQAGYVSLAQLDAIHAVRAPWEAIENPRSDSHALLAVKMLDALGQLEGVKKATFAKRLPIPTGTPERQPGIHSKLARLLAPQLFLSDEGALRTTKVSDAESSTTWRLSFDTPEGNLARNAAIFSRQVDGRQITGVIFARYLHTASPFGRRELVYQHLAVDKSGNVYSNTHLTPPESPNLAGAPPERVASLMQQFQAGLTAVGNAQVIHSDIGVLASSNATHQGTSESSMPIAVDLARLCSAAPDAQLRTAARALLSAIGPRAEKVRVSEVVANANIHLLHGRDPQGGSEDFAALAAGKPTLAYQRSSAIDSAVKQIIQAIHAGPTRLEPRAARKPTSAKTLFVSI